MKLMPAKLTAEMRAAMVEAAHEYMERTGGNSPEAIYEAAYAAATPAVHREAEQDGRDLIYQARLLKAPAWTDVSRDEHDACAEKRDQFETRIVYAARLPRASDSATRPDDAQARAVEVLRNIVAEWDNPKYDPLVVSRLVDRARALVKGAAQQSVALTTEEQIKDIERAAVLIRKNSYPQPDKPHSSWALADRIESVARALRAAGGSNV